MGLDIDTLCIFCSWYVLPIFSFIFGYTADYKRNPTEFVNTVIYVFLGMVTLCLFWLVYWIDSRFISVKKTQKT